MRPLILLTVLLPASAHASSYQPAMTIAQLVRDKLAAPDGGSASLRRARAMG